MKQIGAIFDFTSSLQFWCDGDDLVYRGFLNERLNLKIILSITFGNDDNILCFIGLFWLGIGILLEKKKLVVCMC